ncbi:MAG: sigma-70 family RNA polymerase sigma factor [Bacteroidales bacterium]|nr:sigma-70 family RNA polymerase sigma factor [Bacteroidales bacterium]MDY6000698.1 sigma-70 family RNA polymerase sigma factor [Candidatus Cryptobacteroides sp.]
MPDGKSHISDDSLMSLHKERERFVLLALSFVRDREVAEDLVQESLLYLLENQERIADRNLAGYFSKVVMNKCLDLLRRMRRRGEIEGQIRNGALLDESIAILSGKVSEDAALQVDMSGRIEACRKALPSLAFKVFIASRVGGMTHREIAEEFGIAPRRVNTEVQRALSVFRKEFQDYLQNSAQPVP